MNLDNKQMNATYEKILVVGAGAFGRSLAACALKKGHSVTLLSRTAPSTSLSEQENTIISHCENILFQNFHGSLEQYSAIVLAVPTSALRDVCQWLKSKYLNALNKYSKNLVQLKFILACKGIENDTLSLPHAIVHDVWGEPHLVGVLTGPSFAREMLDAHPTCVVGASNHYDMIDTIITLFHTPEFRIYSCEDMIGAELGGALKNVIAMLVGAVDGMGLGHNTKAAVMTRGLGEMVQVGLTLGADAKTFFGLSGVGDLILTCTGELSRNRKFGYLLAKGESQEHILKTMGGVVEGVLTAKSVYHMQKKFDLDIPLLSAAYSVLYENLPLNKALDILIHRAAKKEFDWNFYDFKLRNTDH